MDIITHCIQHFKEEFIHSLAYLRVKNEYDVNNGFCNEFADFIGRELDKEEYKTFDIISNDNLVDDEELPDSCDIFHFKFENLNRYNISENEFENYKKNVLRFQPDGKIGYHVWIYDEKTKKHYDIECPNGVSNLFEMPFFERHQKEYKFVL